MNWNDSFATRTRSMRRSAVREMLKVTAEPGMISFAGGLPAPELFPAKEIQQAANSVLMKCPGTALQYGQTEGIAALRSWIAERFGLNASNVLIVSGAQQGLDLLGRVLLDEGDTALVENPTYLALLSAWRALGVRFASDKSQFKRERPKLFYVVPNY